MSTSRYRPGRDPYPDTCPVCGHASHRGICARAVRIPYEDGPPERTASAAVLRERARVAALPGAERAVAVEMCRRSPGPCICGAHLRGMP